MLPEKSSTAKYSMKKIYIVIWQEKKIIVVESVKEIS